MKPMNLLICIRAILNASVRMVDQSLAALTTLECGLQGLADLLSVQAVMNVMPYDLSQVGGGETAALPAGLEDLLWVGANA